MTIIKLESSDGEVIETNVENVKCSGLISHAMETCGNGVVPVPEVNSTILRKVLDWAEHHKDDEPQLQEDDENIEICTDDISQWDANFLNVDQKTLYELITAANYLNIKGLVDVIMKTVANVIKTQTPEQIRQTFNLKKDSTPVSCE